jgi:hypothetical protein
LESDYGADVNEGAGENVEHEDDSHRSQTPEIRRDGIPGQSIIGLHMIDASAEWMGVHPAYFSRPAAKPIPWLRSAGMLAAIALGVLVAVAWAGEPGIP